MIPTLLTVAISVSVPCTNLNMDKSPRCTAPVVEMHETTDGFYGTLESGVQWKQTRITPYLHLFEAEEMRWFIYNGKVVMI